jgi:thymidylate synthase (methanogen type)
MEIHAKSIMDAWKLTLSKIYNEGVDFVDQDKRICRELLNVLLIIESVKDIEGPVDVMKSFRDFVYPSKDEIKNTMLSKKSYSGYDYSYGYRLFNYKNIKNQIDDYIIPLLKKNPLSRRAIVTLYDPLVDSDKNMKSVPGLINIYFKIRESKLQISVMIRSNDFFIGWPANIYQIYLLQKYVSDKLNLNTGTITVFSTSAHVFHEHFGKLENIVGINKKKT